MTTLHREPVRAIKVEYGDEPVTSFGGLVLPEMMARKLKMWSNLSARLPARRRSPYSWAGLAKAVVLGLLTGAHGTFAAQGMRGDKALLKLLGLRGVPEEATVWRALDAFGSFQKQGVLPRIQALMARRALSKAPRPALLLEGFVPVFLDGTLLEGSSRREGSKYIKEKGSGLMWSAAFVGSVLAMQDLAPEGSGEAASVRAMIPEVDGKVLKPLRLSKRALVLMDSLHGDEPTLSLLEERRLHYVVGANKLSLTEKTLSEQPESQWESLGPRESLGWTASGVCACWIQCAEWPEKRLLVGRRWKRPGEMIWNYSGVMTDLRERDLRAMRARGLSFASAVWRLYDAKAGMETLFSDGLTDLGLHHPPCGEHLRNAGFYALGALAWVLGTAVGLIGGRGADRGCAVREDGKERARPTPLRMRFWRVRRELYTLPARVVSHGGVVTVRLLGLGDGSRAQFDRHLLNISRC